MAAAAAATGMAALPHLRHAVSHRSEQLVVVYEQVPASVGRAQQGGEAVVHAASS